MIRKVIDCCKWSIMSHPIKGSEDGSAGNCVDCRGPAQEDSDRTIQATGLETIPVHILASNMAAFHPVQRICLRLNLKVIRLVSSVDISRQPNSDSVMHLLVIPFMWVHNEKEQLGQKEIPMYSWEMKRTLASLLASLLPQPTLVNS